jgi:hypothetical protein
MPKILLQMAAFATKCSSRAKHRGNIFLKISIRPGTVAYTTIVPATWEEETGEL